VYRLFYLTRVSQADHNVAILGAANRAELDRQTPAFSTDPSACEKAPPRRCVALPKEVAATTYLTVTVNGAPPAVPVDSSIADALRTAGVSRPADVLASLIVRRKYHGALVPVEFDRGKPDVLVLVLAGGEEIRW